MTKDWDSVQATIHELSVGQKKSLEEVKTIMESRYKFKASTRAYRMKLKEWGYTRHKRRKPRLMTPSGSMRDETGDETDDSAINYDDAREYSPSFLAIPFSEPGRTSPRLALLPSVGPWAQGGSAVANPTVLSEMLAAVCEGDSARLDHLCSSHTSLINYPVGLPFDTHGGRFFNHPVLQTSLIDQHADQTLLDLAAGFPSTEVVYVLLRHGAEGSKNSAGADLALNNAIKNSRSYSVSALIDSGRSSIYGPGSQALHQAVYWNALDIVRILIEKGADVNPIPDASHSPYHRIQTPLQIALDRRASEYSNEHVRHITNEIIKLLLSVGASVHPVRRPQGGPLYTVQPLDAFQTLLKPWQNDPLWATRLNHTELASLQAFISQGADVQAPFQVFPCSTPTCHTFAHQALWHSTPLIVQLVVDSDPRQSRAGAGVLHELLGGCPDAKRDTSELLRDVEIQLRHGADPNACDGAGCTPLTLCLQRLAPDSVEAFVRVLLEGGADPEMRDRQGAAPIEMAGRLYDGALAMRVMEMLIRKFAGRGTGVGLSKWAPGFFPIPRDPSFAQVRAYLDFEGGFALNVADMVAADVAGRFQKAAFAVASSWFIERRMIRTTGSPVVGGMAGLNTVEREEVSKMLALREQAGLPQYPNGQENNNLLRIPSNTASPPIDPLLQTASHTAHHSYPSPNPSRHIIPQSQGSPHGSSFSPSPFLDDRLPVPASIPVSVPLLSLYADDVPQTLPSSVGSETQATRFRRSLSSTASIESLSTVLTPTVMTPTTLGGGLELPVPGMGRWGHGFGKGNDDEYFTNPSIFIPSLALTPTAPAGSVLLRDNDSTMDLENWITRHDEPGDRKPVHHNDQNTPPAMTHCHTLPYRASWKSLTSMIHRSRGVFQTINIDDTGQLDVSQERIDDVDMK